MRIDRPSIGHLMDLLNPLIAGVYGANINRRTIEAVKRAGLKIVIIEHLGPGRCGHCHRHCHRRGDGDRRRGPDEIRPFDVIGAITLNRATLRKMHQNLRWAAGYNTIAFPIAAGLFCPSFGLVLRPEIAALFMSGSSLLAAINALLLKRTRLEGIRTKN